MKNEFFKFFWTIKKFQTYYCVFLFFLNFRNGHLLSLRLCLKIVINGNISTKLIRNRKTNLGMVRLVDL